VVALALLDALETNLLCARFRPRIGERFFSGISDAGIGRPRASASVRTSVDGSGRACRSATTSLAAGSAATAAPTCVARRARARSSLARATTRLERPARSTRWTSSCRAGRSVTRFSARGCNDETGDDRSIAPIDSSNSHETSCAIRALASNHMISSTTIAFLHELLRMVQHGAAGLQKDGASRAHATKRGSIHGRERQ
jgi:hypothetical protein